MTTDRQEGNVRPIKFRAWDKYEIGSDGSVWSTDFNHTGKRKKLKKYRDEDGYDFVYFTIKGVRSIHAVRRLVLTSFVPKPTPKHQVNHKNSIRHDDRLENLEWVTSRENTLHGWRNGRVQSDKARKRASDQFSGTGNPKAKLTAQDVKHIEAIRKSGKMLKDIASAFGISVSQVGAICQGRFWNEK